MPKQAVRRASSNWRRHFFYRKESLRTTWKLRLSLLLLIVLVGTMTSGFWTEQIVRTLVCTEDLSSSDALLVENFDSGYLPFEHANTLNRKHVANRVFVLLKEGNGPGGFDLLSQRVAEIYADAAHLQKMEFLPITESEPITLNAAYRIRDALTAQRIKSVVVVTPILRSRRSMMIYESVLRPAGIRVGCAPVTGRESTSSWTETNHGLFNVFEQFVKLLYYRFYVLW